MGCPSSSSEAPEAGPSSTRSSRSSSMWSTTACPSRTRWTSRASTTSGSRTAYSRSPGASLPILPGPWRPWGTPWQRRSPSRVPSWPSRSGKREMGGSGSRPAWTAGVPTRVRPGGEAVDGVRSDAPRITPASLLDDDPAFPDVHARGLARDLLEPLSTELVEEPAFAQGLEPPVIHPFLVLRGHRADGIDGDPPILDLEVALDGAVEPAVPEESRCRRGEPAHRVADIEENLARPEACAHGLRQLGIPEDQGIQLGLRDLEGGGRRGLAEGLCTALEVPGALGGGFHGRQRPGLLLGELPGLVVDPVDREPQAHDHQDQDEKEDEAAPAEAASPRGRCSGLGGNAWIRHRPLAYRAAVAFPRLS